MRSINPMKRRMLENFRRGLQFLPPFPQSTSITERANAIKLTADIAMAAANRGSAFWSRVLISNASRNATQKPLIRRILKQARYKRSQKKSINTRKTIYRLKPRCGSLVVGQHRSCWSRSEIDLHQPLENPFDYYGFHVATADTRRLVCDFGSRLTRVNPKRKRKTTNSCKEINLVMKNKMEKLKKIVPGGESMEERVLFAETLDYIMSLQAQVEVMHNLVDLSGI